MSAMNSVLVRAIASYIATIRSASQPPGSMIARADDPGRKWLAAVTLVALSDQGEQSGPRVEQKPWILVDQKRNPQRIFHRLEVAAAYRKHWGDQEFV